MRLQPPRAGGRIAATAILVLLPAITAGAASGQSFLQQLFGLGGPQTAAPPAQRLGTPPNASMPSSWSHVPRQSPASDDDGDGSGGRTYRTLCVRTCDGYYFPISNATEHRNFQRDVRACETSCGSEARLFYTPSGEEDAAAMTDLTGLAYSSLPNAFKYRKSLVSGCSCKPMPWSEAERARHRQYAVEETMRRAPRSTVASDVDAESESEPRRPSDLPPPVSGPGVVVISASGVATYAEVAPRGAHATAPEDDAGEAAVAQPALPALAPAGTQARPRVVVINASAAGTPYGRRARVATPPEAGLFGTWLFAPKSRRHPIRARRARD